MCYLVWVVCADVCVCVCVCFVVFDGRCKLLLQLSPRARGSLPEKSKDIYRMKRKREKQRPQKCSRGLHARSRGLSGMFFPAPKSFPSGTVQNDSCPEYICKQTSDNGQGWVCWSGDQGGLISLRPDHTPCILVMHLFLPRDRELRHECCTGISASKLDIASTHVEASKLYLRLSSFAMLCF